MRGRWDTKNNLRGITGLPEILGWDYGIEEPRWGPSTVDQPKTLRFGGRLKRSPR